MSTLQVVAGVAFVSLVSFGAGLLDLGWRFDGVSEAKAQVALSSFCQHYHTWALSGTTGVETFPCPTADADVVLGSDFCDHYHAFALNWTSRVSGEPSVLRWCDDPANWDQPVPESVFLYHYHDNAGTSTTGPQ